MIQLSFEQLFLKNINRRWPFFCCHHDCQSRRLIHPKSWMVLGKVDPLNSSFSTKHREDVWCSRDVWPRVFFCSACIFPSCYQRKQCFLPAQFWKSKLTFLPKLTVQKQWLKILPATTVQTTSCNVARNQMMQQLSYGIKSRFWYIWYFNCVSLFNLHFHDHPFWDMQEATYLCQFSSCRIHRLSIAM